MIRNGLLFLLAAGSLAGAGCMSFNYRGIAEAAHAQTVPFPQPVRNQVYVFALNGSDALELSGMLDLRDKLNCAGFPKFYYAQRDDREWYYREMHYRHRAEPRARFVLMAQGSAAKRTLELAGRALADGLPVDSVVLLDPEGLHGKVCNTPGVTVAVITSHHWTGSSGLVGTENHSIPRVGHYALPTHEGTVNAVVEVLTGAASRVVPDNTELPALKLNEVDVPTPRPVTLKPAALDDWDFLKPLGPFPGLME